MQKRETERQARGRENGGGDRGKREGRRVIMGLVMKEGGRSQNWKRNEASSEMELVMSKRSWN